MNLRFKNVALSLILAAVAFLQSSNARCDATDDAFRALLDSNYHRAFQLSEPSAQAGDFAAQYVLGALYEKGLGVPQDKLKSAEYFRQALIGIRPAAEGNDARAQFVLGRMYFYGLGLAPDATNALMWTRKAAEQHYAPAQHALGVTYAMGDIASKDSDEARSWFRKAAEQGYAPAQYALGGMYLMGDGVRTDTKEAALWIRKAAENGSAAAQLWIANKYSEKKDWVNVRIWEQKAAEQGIAQAQYALATLYEDGLGGGVDERMALGWYQKAADQDFMPQQRQHKTGDLWDDARASRFERRKQAETSAIPKVSKYDVEAMVQTAVKEALPKQTASSTPVHSDVDKPNFSTPENPNNFAVVIGIEGYSSLPIAEYAERDAVAVRAHLTALGYPLRNIYFLSGQQATRAKIAQSLNTWLPQRVNKDSTVLFYYSGHGAPDTQTHHAYLVPVDGDAEDLESTAYPIGQLYAKLGKLKVRQVIVALDSCFSGTGGRSVLAKGTRPLVGKIDLGVVPANIIALTASDNNQISGTIEDQGHGAFTYYLLKGLGGAAKDRAGNVTIQSLYDYLTPKVQDAARLHNRDQTPQLLPARSERGGTRLR